VDTVVAIITAFGSLAVIGHCLKDVVVAAAAAFVIAKVIERKFDGNLSSWQAHGSHRFRSRFVPSAGQRCKNGVILGKADRL